MVKNSLILGGAGALGKSVVTSFKRGGWRVLNVDLNENGEADKNLKIETSPMKLQVPNIVAETKSFAKE